MSKMSRRKNKLDNNNLAVDKEFAAINSRCHLVGFTYLIEYRGPVSSSFITTLRQRKQVWAVATSMEHVKWKDL